MRSDLEQDFGSEVIPMQITLTPQSVVALAAIIGAIVAIATYLAKIVRWVDKQSAQDLEIQKLKVTFQTEINSLKAHHDQDIKDLKEEQTLNVYGILACLKGLQEQGCNGPVAEAINKIEKYLNQKAHR